MNATVSKCPVQHTMTTPTITFKEAPPQYVFKKLFFASIEFLSRFSWKSLRNAWAIASEHDLSKTLTRAWRPGSIVSRCPTLVGTIYLTADPDMMRAVLQNLRANDEGIFLDHENKKIFIKGVLNDIFPEEIKRMGVDAVSEMIVMTASVSQVKVLRAPIVNTLTSACVKEFIPQINAIADDILMSLSAEEKNNCNAQALAFEFAVTVISKLITGYHTSRENYQALAGILEAVSKRMTRLVSHRPATAAEDAEYQQAIEKTKDIIDSNIYSPTPSPFVAKLKELGWDDFRIRVNLYFMYFAASETSASSINYLLWQLGREENASYVEELKHPEKGEAFLSKVIAETLRLHPPAFIMGRQFRQDTLLEIKNAAGQSVKRMRLLRGHSILCLAQIAGRDPLRYPDPERFNPHRFEQVPAQLPWYPFGTGHHVCPGQHLAYAELKCLVSQMLKKFTLQTLTPKGDIQQGGFFTLRATPACIKLTD